jgi:hypothetical protein
VIGTMAMATATTLAMATVTRWRVTKREIARGARAIAMVTRMVVEQQEQWQRRRQDHR